MKTAKDLVAGDKLKAGAMICEVKAVRMVGRGTDLNSSVKHILIEGQPEIEAWNLQKFIDQGSIVIL